jgi:hypothetical protein
MVVEDDRNVELWADFEEVVYVIAYLDEQSEFLCSCLEQGRSILPRRSPEPVAASQRH